MREILFNELDFFKRPKEYNHSIYHDSKLIASVVCFAFRLTLIGMSYESNKKCSPLAPPRSKFIRLNELGRVSNYVS